MRKIKHWAGYGTVQMEVVEKTKSKLVVRIVGEHECGLDRDDVYDMKCWLFDRIYKNNTISEYDLLMKVDYVNWRECIYTFTPRWKETF